MIYNSKYENLKTFHILTIFKRFRDQGKTVRKLLQKLRKKTRITLIYKRGRIETSVPWVSKVAVIINLVLWQKKSRKQTLQNLYRQHTY